MKNILMKAYSMNRFVFCVVILSIVVITLDLEISNIADFVKKYLISNSGLLTFNMIFAIFWISQVALYYSIRNKLKMIKFRGKNLLFIDKLLRTSLWLLLLLNLMILVEVLKFEHYSVYLLMLIVSISYSLNAFFMGLLSYLLLAWNKTRKNNILLCYSLAATLASVSAILTLIYMIGILVDKPEEISSNTEVVFSIFEINSYNGVLNILNTISFLSSFVFMWIGSITVLKHYLLNTSKTRYFLIIGAPFVYYIGQYVTIINIIVPFIDSSSITFIYFYSIFFTLSSVIGSVIFAMSFWLIAKDLGRNKDIAIYLSICGYGFILFFSSATATVIHTPYPPFGIASISLVGFSAYYILFGIYSSSVSLSEDITLRDLIRKSSASQLKFLTSISIGYLEDKIINQVLETSLRFKQNSVEQTGITSSLSRDEIKIYIQQVVEEIRAQRGSDSENMDL